MLINASECMHGNSACMGINELVHIHAWNYGIEAHAWELMNLSACMGINESKRMHGN